MNNNQQQQQQQPPSGPPSFHSTYESPSNPYQDGNLPRYPSNASLISGPSPLNPNRHTGNATSSHLRNDYPAEDSNQQESLYLDDGRDSRFLSNFYRRWSSYPTSESEIFLAKNGGTEKQHISTEKPQITFSPHNRLHYLDGLRWLCAAVVVNGTLFSATLTDDDYPAIQRDSPLYILRSTNLAISLLLIISGRALLSTGNLWRVPQQSSTVSPVPEPNTDFPRLSRAMLLRPFRFLIPVIFVAGLQWGLGATGKTGNAAAAGMDPPLWDQIDNFGGFTTLIWNLFTVYESDTTSGKAFGSNLFTVPWFFQGSYCAYVVHLMLGNLSSNRFWIYAVLAFFSWCTFNYFYLIIIGLVISDLDAHGYLARFHELHFVKRFTVQIIFVIIALVTQWVPVIRDNINHGLSVINVQGHGELTFCDSIFATVILLLIETSDWGRVIFGNKVVRHLGKLAPGMYLMAPAIVYTIVPNIAVNLHDKQNFSSSSVLGVSWIALFALCNGLGLLFYLVLELPSLFLAEWIGDVFMLGGLKNAGRRIPAQLNSPSHQSRSNNNV